MTSDLSEVETEIIGLLRQVWKIAQAEHARLQESLRTGDDPDLAILDNLSEQAVRDRSALIVLGLAKAACDLTGKAINRLATSTLKQGDHVNISMDQDSLAVLRALESIDELLSGMENGNRYMDLYKGVSFPTFVELADDVAIENNFPPATRRTRKKKP